MLATAYDLLYDLGITANYAGFFQAACAIDLCMEQPKRLLLVTKAVYPEVAKRYKTSWKAVERNIRTVNKLIWERNWPALERLAGKSLPCKPSNAQLLAILSYCLFSRRADPPAPIGRAGHPSSPMERIRRRG